MIQMSKYSEVQKGQLKSTRAIQLIGDQNHGFKNNNIAWIISMSQEAECSDTRDRVFGILSLCAGGLAFPVDYGFSLMDIFHQFIHHFADEENVDMMCHHLSKTL